MKFDILLEKVISKEALNTQFFYTRLEDISDTLQLLSRIADFYIAKLEKQKFLQPNQKKIFAGTVIRARNAVKAARKVIDYSTIGEMPVFQSKFKEIEEDAKAIQEKVGDKVDQAYFELAQTDYFKPQKAGLQALNSIQKPVETDDTPEEEMTASCEEIKQALNTKYVRKFTSIKNFLELRFIELKRVNKKDNANIMNITLDFDSFCENNPENMVYAKPSEDYTKIEINLYPIYDALRHFTSVSQINQKYVNEEILDNALTKILIGNNPPGGPEGDGGQDAYINKFNTIRGKVTNRFRR